MALALDSSISIFQKNWAFTKADASKAIIKTGPFGPCFVVIFTSPGYAAMAHMDDLTTCESIQQVFDRFRENNVKLEKVKVKVLGGWKNQPRSSEMGEKLIALIEKVGIKEINKSRMFQKVYDRNVLDTIELANQPTFFLSEDLQTHRDICSQKTHYLGAKVNAKNGETLIFEVDVAVEEKRKEPKPNYYNLKREFTILDNEQTKLSEAFINKYGVETDRLFDMVELTL